MAAQLARAPLGLPGFAFLLDLLWVMNLLCPVQVPEPVRGFLPCLAASGCCTLGGVVTRPMEIQIQMPAIPKDIPVQSIFQQTVTLLLHMM